MSKKDVDPWVRTFTVSDPIRHKKGYTLYKVISKVFPRNSIEAVTQVVVWKRYNDFKKLHKALHSIHQGLYLKGTFPPFAKARFFGRFDENVVEERRKCALELLEFAGNYPPLFTSQIFVKFFEGCQIVDVSASEGEKCDGPLLQPVISTASKNSPPDLDSSLRQEDSEPNSGLGGIWQHRQVADEISISSCTATEGEDEDDDRTTFTDDDAGGSKLGFDLSEFDPVLQSATLQNSSALSQKSQDTCNDWLLSAFNSCGVNKDIQELDCILTFPKPFENHKDDGDDGNTIGSQETSAIKENIETQPVITETTATSEARTSLMSMQEFDPLYDMQKCSNSDSLNVNFFKNDTTYPAYVLHAAKCINAAQCAEVDAKYFDAFTFYKAAVDVLLQGVQNEKSADICGIVRPKILQYLKRAEELYETHLAEDNSRDQGNKAPICPSNICSEKPCDLSLRKKISDLAKYRVIGILSRVLLVLNTITNSTCVVKVLRKSPYPQQRNNPNIAPQSIPFMVKLYEVYETTDAIYLILEYASGGRLWDYISSYLQRSPPHATNLDFQILGHQSKDDFENVYSAKKLSVSLVENPKESCPVPKDDNTSRFAADPDLVPSSNCPRSYVALFKNYLVASQKGNSVSLAKCNIIPSNLSDSSDSFQDIDSDQNFTVSCSNLSLVSDDCSQGNTLNHTKLSTKPESSKYSDAFSTEAHNSNNVIDSSKALMDIVDHTIEIASGKKYPLDENGGCKSIVNGKINDYVPCSNPTDLPTFLCGDSGKNFLCQNEREELGRDSTLKANQVNNISSGVSSHLSSVNLSKEVATADMFNAMDSALTAALSRQIHLPESCVAMWAAEMVTALISLHKLGIIWQDLMPENILLGSEGHILLTYQSHWNSVDWMPSQVAIANLYAAPEVDSIFPVTPACDWWSLGAILFELLTGKKLVFCHPGGITSHTSLFMGSDISPEAADLLKKLLTFSASDRLGSGIQGEEDIKFHPFFRSYQWS